MNWDKLRIFHAVADAGSLTHAGESLRLSQSAVSRQVRSLEESLNTTLFHRHARGLILTEQGELLFDATTSINKRLDAASARIRDSEEEVFGELSILLNTKRTVTTVALKESQALLIPKENLLNDYNKTSFFIKAILRSTYVRLTNLNSTIKIDLKSLREKA